MLILYHSRGAFPARLAAAIHVGTLPPSPPIDLTAALERLGGASALKSEGLWAAGIDRDGNHVYALGRASRPDVVHRAFHSLADLAGLDDHSFRLHNAGPPVAWDDMAIQVYQMMGLDGAAQRRMLRTLETAWPEAAQAVTAEPQPAPDRPPAPPPGDGLQRIVYYCYGSAHSSITCANLHLGHLPLDRRPGPYELLHQPLFDRAEDHELGLFRHMGDDEWGNAIYVLGLAGGKTPMCRGLVDLLAACGSPVGAFRFEPTLNHSGVLLRIGGYTSRGLGLVPLGRPLCALGVWLKFWRFAGHVEQVRADYANLRQQPSP